MFTDRVAPEGAFVSGDLDADGDGGVVWWVEDATMYVSTQKAGQDVISNKSAYNMFRMCSTLTTLDVSYLDTSQVTDMRYMFANCTKLPEIKGLESLDTSNVTNMSYMFSTCNLLTILDLTSFDTSKATNMSYMFASLPRLTTIYVSDGWTTAGVTQTQILFNTCTKLVGGNGTAYSSTKRTAAYACIDDPDAGTPGYFSIKPVGRVAAGVVSMG